MSSNDIIRRKQTMANAAELQALKQAVYEANMLLVQ